MKRGGGGGGAEGNGEEEVSKKTIRNQASLGDKKIKKQGKKK